MTKSRKVFTALAWGAMWNVGGHLLRKGGHPNWGTFFNVMSVIDLAWAGYELVQPDAVPSDLDKLPNLQAAQVQTPGFIKTQPFVNVNGKMIPVYC